VADLKRKPARVATATEALFVRIPAEHARRLDRAAFELRRPKQALVSELLERYVDPDSPASLAALAERPPTPADAAVSPRADALAEAGRRRVTVETLEPDAMVVGYHSFRPREPQQVAGAQEVLSGEQAAELLQVTPAVIERLAARGELPARQLAGEWRFSRAALLAWLAAPAAGGRPDGQHDDR
jgi:excisionase family DNA binding protein